MIDIRELSIESQDGIAILIKGKLSERNIKTEFIPPIRDRDIHHSIFAANLESKGKKPLVGEMREHCAQLLPALNQLNIKILYVTDSTYFGFLTGLKAKPAEYEGYALPCVIHGFEHMLCILGVHPYVCSVNPDKYKNQIYALDTLQRVVQGVYSHPGQDVIRFAEYPKTITDIADWLTKLHSYPELVCDIETFSLKHIYAGLGTIAFAWDKHSGIAFNVSVNRSYREIRTLLIMLRKFFIAYQGKLTYHNMGYDAKQLIYMLFMDSPWDYNGMLFGLNIMTRRYDDTKIISYLATNSAAGNALGLKEQCKEFLGKYSEEDIKDITLIPLQELLEYNLKDCCGTWFVKEKNYPKMVHDEQLQIYEEIFKPAIKQIIQMELIGLPVNSATVLEVSTELENFQQELLIQILNHPVVKQFWEEYELPKMVEVKNSELKTKVIDAEYFIHKQFNPNSHSQMARLLFDFIGFEVVSYTKAKQPSTDGDTLTELYAKALELEEHSIAELLKAIMEYGKVNKIITSFIPPFRDAVLFPDGIARVFGSFNLGGTVSGRLSSSGPNLQNLNRGF